MFKLIYIHCNKYTLSIAAASAECIGVKAYQKNWLDMFSYRRLSRLVRNSIRKKEDPLAALAEFASSQGLTVLETALLVHAVWTKLDKQPTNTSVGSIAPPSRGPKGGSDMRPASNEKGKERASTSSDDSTEDDLYMDAVNEMSEEKEEEENATASPFDALADELLVEIFKDLSLSDVQSLRMACKTERAAREYLFADLKKNILRPRVNAMPWTKDAEYTAQDLVFNAKLMLRLTNPYPQTLDHPLMAVFWMRKALLLQCWYDVKSGDSHNNRVFIEGSIYGGGSYGLADVMLPPHCVKFLDNLRYNYGDKLELRKLDYRDLEPEVRAFIHSNENWLTGEVFDDAYFLSVMIVAASESCFMQKRDYHTSLRDIQGHAYTLFEAARVRDPVVQKLLKCVSIFFAMQLLTVWNFFTPRNYAFDDGKAVDISTIDVAGTADSDYSEFAKKAPLLGAFHLMVHQLDIFEMYNKMTMQLCREALTFVDMLDCAVIRMPKFCSHSHIYPDIQEHRLVAFQDLATVQDTMMAHVAETWKRFMKRPQTEKMSQSSIDAVRNMVCSSNFVMLRKLIPGTLSEEYLDLLLDPGKSFDKAIFNAYFGILHSPNNEDSLPFCYLDKVHLAEDCFAYLEPSTSSSSSSSAEDYDSDYSE